jgi:hypothetical protein
MPFVDVDVYNPFYVYIRCLYCRGIISGYDSNPPCTTGTPCFRPYDTVSRGQAAKIVSNAAGYSDAIPSTQQTFSDVSPANPFWIYVERAVLHGVINGYSGGPPCPSSGPCFRPYDPVTRGQLAKIDSNAAGYSDVPAPGTQTFADVLPSWRGTASSTAMIAARARSTPAPAWSKRAIAPADPTTARATTSRAARRRRSSPTRSSRSIARPVSRLGRPSS